MREPQPDYMLDYPENDYVDEHYDMRPRIPLVTLKDRDFYRAAILDDLQIGYVHNLVRPVVQNGQLVLRTKVPGREYELTTYATEFLGRFRCSGSEDKIDEFGYDKSCPACSYHAQHPDRVARPLPRYATNLVVYRTDPGSAHVRHPFEITVGGFTFSEELYASILRELRGNYEGENVADHDLLIKVRNRHFEAYDVHLDYKAQYQASPEYKAKTEETYAAHALPSALLQAIIAPEMGPGHVEHLLSQVTAAWGRVRTEEELVEEEWAKLGVRAKRRALDSLSKDKEKKDDGDIDFFSLLDGVFDN